MLAHSLRLLLVSLALLASAVAQEPQRPSILILPAERKADYPYLQELYKKGFDVDYGLREDDPLDWERMRKFNCIVLLSLPVDERGHDWRSPPFRAEFEPLLARYREAGGGVFVMLNTHEQLISPYYESWNSYLANWGAQLPLEGIYDPATEMLHPHSRQPFIYTNRIAPSPVSDGVEGIWVPRSSGSGNVNFKTMTSPLIVDDSWQVVVRGSASSYAERLKPGFALRKDEMYTPIAREARVDSPPLFAIRDQAPSRMALIVTNPVFHLLSGTSWAHDRIMLGKGLDKRPSNFDKLLENTLRWLAAPSIESGTLGGYVQDPQMLKHPHFRKPPNAYFSEFDSYQNPVPPAEVYRGLIGAQSGFSSGTGTVAEYAAAARRAGLDFIVFLEEFAETTEEKLRQLEAECKANSAADLLLIPGFTMQTNIGNHIFFMGNELVYPKGNQLGGENGQQLRLQNFDDKGNLELSDEAAKNLLWQYVGGKRNIGYYNFANSAPGSVPVRNLRLYGMLGAITYIDGKQVEDVTDEFLKLTPQGNPPRLCTVNIVASPAALEQAVADKQYLTHVASTSVETIMGRMVYGHAYSRDNVNPSSGPRIHAWAGTQRVMTFGGEPFVTARYRIPQLVKVSSDVGLKELRIFSDGVLYRRILLDGEKEFERTFQWSFDRQRGFVLEAIDIHGGRAFSGTFETWTDSNAMSWCGDRQNGELWHGPFAINAVWGSGVLTWHSIGQTWDGGSALTPFAGINLTTSPALWDSQGKSENANGHLPRAMEGYTYATCVDDTVRNIAGEAWNIYAPGKIANGYHTLGPIRPAEQMRYKLRRTMYLPRQNGPLLDWHAMWSERQGGGLALFEGEMTVLRETELGNIMAGMLRTINFDDDRVGIWAIRRNNEAAPVCGPLETIVRPNRLLLPQLGQGKATNRLTVEKGGYVGTFGLVTGTPSALFNVDDRPISWEPSFHRLYLNELPKTAAAGETFTWQLLYLWDGFDHGARNLARLEKIRSYYGLDGHGNSGIELKQGNLIRHFGLVDLAPENGIVEFQAPQPDFELDMPLPLRFIGFNPNWSVGQWQLKGYSSGYYTNGQNVYRNLGIDDRAMVHLGVYTWGVPMHHSIVGHPVQCDAPQLNIQVTALKHNPFLWHVAVNNPTDAPIRTTLRKAMDLPGLELPEAPVDVAPGGYLVLLDQQPPPGPKTVSKIVPRPEALTLVQRGDEQALRVSFTGIDGAVTFQNGAYGTMAKPVEARQNGEFRFRIGFDARHIEGAFQLAVSRPWGGSSTGTTRLTSEWQRHTVEVVCDSKFTVDGFFFTPARGSYAADGTFELSNVTIHLLDADDANLAANPTFALDMNGWKAMVTVRVPADE